MTDFQADAPWREYFAIGEVFAADTRLISEQPDFTLDEIVSVLHKRRIPGSRSALSRFFARHGITVKKKSAGAERKRADVLGTPTLGCASRLLDPPPCIHRRTAVTTNMVRLSGWNPARRALGRGCAYGILGNGDVCRCFRKRVSWRRC